MKLQKHILARLIVAIGLSAAALVLFFMSRSAITKIEQSKEALSPAIAMSIDRDVDSVLTRFKIEKSWIRKNSVRLTNSTLHRIERRIAVPAENPTVQMNVALNAMAKRYGGRAVASENVKENAVTIHIELRGYVIQTIILKTASDIKSGGRTAGLPKV